MLFRIPYRKLSKKTEEDLIDEFTSSGDLDLLGELYSRYMHLTYGVCLKYLKDRDEASDAVMQIFEKLITDIPKQKIENFRSWLHVVAKNYCLMQLRSRKSRNERMKEWADDSVVFMENNPVLHPVDEDKQDLDKNLEECIENLKAEQRECIRQFYYENRCYKEIATSMDLDENKVKSHLQNAKRNLKICLEEKNGENK